MKIYQRFIDGKYPSYYIAKRWREHLIFGRTRPKDDPKHNVNKQLKNSYGGKLRTFIIDERLLIFYLQK